MIARFTDDEFSDLLDVLALRISDSLALAVDCERIGHDIRASMNRAHAARLRSVRDKIQAEGVQLAG